MNKLAYLLISTGFVGGAFVAVLDPTTVQWGWFAGPAIAGLAGVFLLRNSVHGAASADHKLDEGVDTLRQSLDSIVANLKDLNERRDELPPHEVRFDIDRLFRNDLNAFADARECMIHRFGLRNYANIMSGFAAGERYINRIWSASTDGYVDEVRLYLDKALHQFIEARDLFASAASKP
jgi:hypothetical protein